MISCILFRTFITHIYIFNKYSTFFIFTTAQAKYEASQAIVVSAAARARTAHLLYANVLQHLQDNCTEATLAHVEAADQTKSVADAKQSNGVLEAHSSVTSSASANVSFSAPISTSAVKSTDSVAVRCGVHNSITVTALNKSASDVAAAATPTTAGAESPSPLTSVLSPPAAADALNTINKDWESCHKDLQSLRNELEKSSWKGRILDLLEALSNEFNLSNSVR